VSRDSLRWPVKYWMMIQDPGFRNFSVIGYSVVDLTVSLPESMEEKFNPISDSVMI
jgi:hypothetical protein